MMTPTSDLDSSSSTKLVKTEDNICNSDNSNGHLEPLKETEVEDDKIILDKYPNFNSTNDFNETEKVEGCQNEKDLLQPRKKYTLLSSIKHSCNNKDSSNSENSDSNEQTDFKKFLDIVLEMEKIEEDKVKLARKLNKYYNYCDPEYVKSVEFCNLLEKCLEKLMKNSLHLYFVVKEVLDSLYSHRVLFHIRKSRFRLLDQGISKDSAEDADEVDSIESFPFDEDARDAEVVEKLTRVLETLHKRIKDLEYEEVDLSDEEDSCYFKLQRYRDKFCQVYKKLCSYTCQSPNAKRVLGSGKFEFSGTNNHQLNRAVEAWMNKTKKFPDFSDVLKLIEELNQSLSLGYAKEKIRTSAVDVFTQIGNSLQRQRKYDLWDSFSLYLENEVDPAVTDLNLRQILDKNYEIGVQKEMELLNYYADKQDKDNVEPDEVSDEEVTSSEQSDDEDEKEIVEAENILKNKMDLDVSDFETEDDGNETLSVTETEGYEKGSDNSITGSCIPDSEPDEQLKCDTTSPTKTETSVKESFCTYQEYRVLECVHITDPSRYEFHANKTISEKSCSSKRYIENEEKERAKKQRKCSSDSDSEVIFIESEDEDRGSGEDMKLQTVQSIQHAFINKNFKNSMLSNDDFFRIKSSVGWALKTQRVRRRYTYPCPLSDSSKLLQKSLYSVAARGLEKKKHSQKRDWYFSRRHISHKVKLKVDIEMLDFDYSKKHEENAVQLGEWRNKAIEFKRNTLRRHSDDETGGFASDDVSSQEEPPDEDEDDEAGEGVTILGGNHQCESTDEEASDVGPFDGTESEEDAGTAGSLNAVEEWRGQRCFSSKRMRSRWKGDACNGSHNNEGRTDEEIVQNFLHHAPRSLSIKCPRNFHQQEKPSTSVNEVTEDTENCALFRTSPQSIGGDPENEETNDVSTDNTQRVISVVSDTDNGLISSSNVGDSEFAGKQDSEEPSGSTKTVQYVVLD